MGLKKEHYMDTTAIIDSLNREIGNLQQAREILSHDKLPRVKGSTTKRIISPQGRKNIAAAQRKRWAKSKAA
jgi:hypothetical protein